MIKDLTNLEYHRAEGYSCSDLKNILKSPKHFKYARENDMKSSTSMALGSALHLYFLQPVIFNQTFAMVERKDKKVLESMHELDYESLQPAYTSKFVAMSRALDTCAEVQELIANAWYIETPFFHGRWKCMADLITKDGWIIDLKTVGGGDTPSEPDKFKYDFFKFDYDLQMYFYKKFLETELKEELDKRGIKIKGFKFICVDADDEVSGIKIYTFFDEEGNRSKWFELGAYKFKEAVTLLDKYENEEEFPVYEEINEVDLPMPYDAEKMLAELGDKYGQQ